MATQPDPHPDSLPAGTENAPEQVPADEPQRTDVERDAAATSR